MPLYSASPLNRKEDLRNEKNETLEEGQRIVKAERHSHRRTKKKLQTNPNPKPQ
jgi:hypothetical protein